MPTNAPTDGQPHPPSPPRPRARRAHRRIIVGSVLVLGIGTVLALTAWVGYRALTAKDALEDAQRSIAAVRSGFGRPEAPSLLTAATRLQADTARAAAQTDDPVWRLYEHLPWLGANLTAFRQTTEVLDALVRDGVMPAARAADGLSLDSLAPREGRIDLEPLRRLTPAVTALDDATQRATRDAAAIRTSGVLPQLTGRIGQLRDVLGEVAPRVHTARTVLPVLYPALGGEGERRYLMIFQNNAEERASGGNPASMAMLSVRDGRIKLGRQADSRDFPHPYRRPPYTPRGAGSGDWGTVYTDYASTYVTNITMTPDFPTTAKLARAMWRDRIGGRVDGVISFDPVALSYLLKATGPVTLADGKRIGAENAVSYLLFDVYARYPDPKRQDEVFASAAEAIFAAVTHGRGDPQAYLDALRPVVQEQRLKLWSVRPAEQDLLLRSPLGNLLPADNASRTVVGVYNNDDATSKMSYFMKQRVGVTTDRCRPEPRYRVAATVTNTLSPARVGSLPEYVRAHQQRIVPGGDRQWVQLYGPVGAKLLGASIDGKKVVWGTSLNYKANRNPRATGAADRRPAVRGTMYGRPVGVVSINLGPGKSATVRAEFVGASADSPDVAVSHTPKVRAVPVKITAATCSR